MEGGDLQQVKIQEEFDLKRNTEGGVMVEEMKKKGMEEKDKDNQSCTMMEKWYWASRQFWKKNRKKIAI